MVTESDESIGAETVTVKVERDETEDGNLGSMRSIGVADSRDRDVTWLNV